MAMAIVVGIPLGVAMGVWRPAEKLLNVWVNIFISAPLTALVPALMPLLGIGQTTVIATVFLFAVWVLVIDTQAGIRHVGGSLVDMARLFGAPPAQIFFKVLLPCALPEILTGLRLAVVRGVKGVVIGQIIIGSWASASCSSSISRTFSWRSSGPWCSSSSRSPSCWSRRSGSSSAASIFTPARGETAARYSSQDRQ